MSTEGGADELRVLIAASGTGGHLFPAVFIARAFERQVKRAKIEFVGAGRPLEEQIVGSAGYKVHIVKMSGIKQRGFLGVLRAIALMPNAVYQVIKLIRAFRPHVVVGVGGYVAFVPITVAKLFRIPTWIHEAELKPGTANQIMIYYADKVSIAFREAAIAGRKNVVYTGHPIREELKNISRALDPGENPRRVLVLGGSQGARALDEALPQLSAFLLETDIEIWHQCRPENVDEVQTAYRKNAVNARVVPFIDNMPMAYAWADVVISRAGAGAVMELSAVNRPALLVPYPFAQGDHQTANAMTLVKAGKALLVKESKHFLKDLERNLALILEPKVYQIMVERPYPGRSVDGADNIAKGCLELIEKRTKGRVQFN